MVMTDEILVRGRSAAGGWNRAQLAVLGVAWPPVSGWKRSLVGKEYDESVVTEFLRLRKGGMPGACPACGRPYENSSLTSPRQ